jgi:hypothetical protein
MLFDIWSRNRSKLCRVFPGGAECVSSEILPQIPIFKMGVRGQTRLKACFLGFGRKIDQKGVIFWQTRLKACFLGFGRKIDQKADVSDAVYI